VGVVAQTRDPRQREIRIEYDVRQQWPARLLWLVLGAVALSTLIVRRKARLA
jgi:hypothetical protein